MPRWAASTQASSSQASLCEPVITASMKWDQDALVSDGGAWTAI
jgi:hypothetical protein